MASALYPLRKVQFGVETTPGALVAATNQLVADCSYTPDVQRVYPAFMRPFRVPQADGGIDTRKASLLSVRTDLDFEQIMLFLDTGFVARTTTGSNPYTHTYDFNPGALAPARAATWEFVVDDGTTKQYERRFGFGTTQRLALDFAQGQTVRLDAQLFGRAEQAMTMTAGRSALTRTTVLTSDLVFTVDPTWATLGVTTKTFVVRFGHLDLAFGPQPGYGFEGRPDLDFTHVQQGQLSATLSLTLEHNADAATEIAAWRARTKRFVRISATNGSKSLRFDLAGYYSATPRFARLDDTEVVTLVLTVDMDTAGNEAVAARIVNALASI